MYLRWWRRLTLRGRISLVSTAVVSVGVVLGAVVLVLAVRLSLEASLDASAKRAGMTVAAMVVAGTAPTTLVVTTSGVEQVQVVNVDATQVTHASAGGDQSVPLLTLSEQQRALGGAVIQVSAARANTADDLRVVAVAVGNGLGDVVLVATTVSRIVDAERVVRNAALFGAPIGLIAVAVLTYLVVGRTLRPVAELREGARKIAASGRLGPDGPRLPVPGARDEVWRLAVTLNMMLDRLAAANAQQRAFVDDAAHELRSPLASLRVQLEVAARLGPANDWDEVAHDALIDVDRLTRLVDDLLALARLDAAAATTAPAAADDVAIGPLAHDVLAGYPAVIGDVRVGDDVAISGQPDALRRLLVNLLDNAVRHASSRVSLTVSADEQVRIVIADDGPGIPAAERERVFDRFYRVDYGRARDDGGTGLGLAIVRDVVDGHHGTVALDDNDPGLQVTVTFPVSAT